MKPIVVDSSVTVKWLNGVDEKYLKQADKLLKDAQAGTVNILAPELSKYEIGNALLNKCLDLPKAYESLGTVYILPIIFIPETRELAIQTYRFALQSGITYYDATFVALAKREKAVLVTDNPKHQGKQLDVAVVPLKNY